MTGAGTKIHKIRLKQLQGWFVATSESEELKGLYLTNPSYDLLVGQIAAAIKLLYRAQLKEKDVI